MPMEAMPFAQLLVAVATKWAGVVTVAPFAGLDTVTLANTEINEDNNRTNSKKTHFRIKFPLPRSFIESDSWRESYWKVLGDSRGGTVATQQNCEKTVVGSPFKCWSYSKTPKGNSEHFHRFLHSSDQ